LLDQTDGSLEQVEKAFAVSRFCWNLALLPKDQREQGICDLRANLNMDDDEFDAFRRSVVVPMIERHRQMFPGLHERSHTDWSPIDDPVPRASSRTATRAEKYPGTGPYDPCPCNSGRKYKFCCRAKAR
jgi:hypothetical protein